MAKLKVGDVVIYENRECKITELTDNSAVLTNLRPRNESDWIKVKVCITDIEEEK